MTEFFKPVAHRHALQSSLLLYKHHFEQQKKNSEFKKNEIRNMSVFITGLPGCGKTHTIKNTFFYDKNKHKSVDGIGYQWHLVNPDVFYFNCCGKGNFIRRLVVELKKWKNKHMSSKKKAKARVARLTVSHKTQLSDEKIWKEIKLVIQNKTIILDEIDTIPSHFMYTLLEIDNLLIFCIANKMVYENRVMSRIKAVIGVECYTSKELREIMLQEQEKTPEHKQSHTKSIHMEIGHLEQTRCNEKKNNPSEMKKVDTHIDHSILYNIHDKNCNEKETQEIITEIISKRVSSVNGDARRVMRYKQRVIEEKHSINDLGKDFNKTIKLVDDLFRTTDFHQFLWNQFSDSKKILIRKYLNILPNLFDEKEKIHASYLELVNTMAELDRNGVTADDPLYIKEDIEEYDKEIFL